MSSAVTITSFPSHAHLLRPLSYKCRTCRLGEGSPCRGYDGRARPPHNARWERVAKARRALERLAEWNRMCYE